MTDVGNKPAPAKPGRRPGKWAWFWLALLIAVAGIALAVCLWPQPGQPDLKDAFAWLTPAETAKVFGPPGSLTRLKFRFLMWSPRIWKWYVGAKTQIQITISVLEVASNGDLAQGEIVAPGGRCFTNSDGMRSWVVPAEQWPQAQRDLHSWTKSTMRMTTMEGMDGTMFYGALGAPSASISISPRLKRGGFDLLLNATYSSRPNANATNSPQPAQSVTNLAVVCRAIIPNGGALVVDGGKNPHAPGNENYWLIISPVAVDSKGKPKKIQPLAAEPRVHPKPALRRSALFILNYPAIAFTRPPSGALIQGLTRMRAEPPSGKDGQSGLRTRAESGKGVQRACPLARVQGGASPDALRTRRAKRAKNFRQGSNHRLADCFAALQTCVRVIVPWQKRIRKGCGFRSP